MSRKQAKALLHYNQALALHGAGRPADALDAYQKAIVASPDIAPLHEGRGIALAQIGRQADALKSFNRAAGLDRSSASILINRGTVLNELNRAAEALADFDRVLALTPDKVPALYGAGNSLLKLDRIDDALERFDRLLSLQPDFALALSGRGLAYAALGRRDDAMEAFTEGLRLNPDAAEIWYNRGACFEEMRRFREAASDYHRAIELDSSKAQYFMAAGNAVRELGMLDHALTLFDRAAELAPDDFDARWNRAMILQLLRRHEDAIPDYDFALTREPGNAAILVYREIALRSVHLWREPPFDAALLPRWLETTSLLPAPFPALGITDDPAVQLQVAVRHIRAMNAAPAVAPGPYARHDRIRIGYFSSDFFDHATMHLMAEMLEKHDRDRFEVTAFSYGWDDKSVWSGRAQAAVENFIDVREKTDSEIAALARELEIDIAVDLKGFTQSSRPHIFAARAAPIQVNYLGYPGTMGCEFIDYIVGDEIVTPKEDRGFYTEKIVSLPDSYQPNCRQRTVDGSPTRSNVGLPQDAVVLCSFNQGYKLSREGFGLWMRILKEVEGSVLWTWVPHDAPRERLRTAVERHGIDAARLVFAETLPTARHLARLPLADLFLDTLPYNAHTTASDALRMGVPVLTCPGRAFASRVAASLLTAAGLTELIAPTLGDYVRLAIELSSDRQRLAELKAKVQTQALQSPLFDSARYARHIEMAYEAMYDRQMAGLPPDHIDIK